MYYEILFFLFSPSLKNVKTTPNSQVTQKQALGQIWSTGCSLPTPDHWKTSKYPQHHKAKKRSILIILWLTQF